MSDLPVLTDDELARCRTAALVSMGWFQGWLQRPQVFFLMWTVDTGWHRTLLVDSRQYPRYEVRVMS